MRSTMLQIAVALALVAPALAADPPAKADAKTDASTAAKADAKAGGDAETVALVCALNEHEIVAGAVAEQKKVTGAVLDYAKMLEREHGQNLVDTLVLAQKSKLSPSETPAVAELKKKGAAGLNELVQKDGDAFSKAFVDAMVKGHTDAVALLDQRIAGTSDAALKKHLTDTRGHVQMHLDQAKKLQSSSTTNAATSTTK